MEKKMGANLSKYFSAEYCPLGANMLYRNRSHPNIYIYIVRTGGRFCAIQCAMYILHSTYC